MLTPRSCRRLLLALVALVLASFARGEPAAVSHPTGSPFLHVWGAEDYHAAPVNWHVMQHPATGFVYAGNNFGVLEFDGAVWRLIELPSSGRAHPLTIDAAGQVWAAGDDIVRLEPDATGSLRAVSQIDQLPAADRAVGYIVFAASTREAVGFANAQALYVFPTSGAPFAIRAEADILSLWDLHDALHVALTNGKLLRLEGTRLVPADFSLALPERTGVNRVVHGVREIAPGTVEFLTNRGLLTARKGEDHATLTVAFPSDLVGDSQITSATLLRDGGFACSTARSGLLVFDRDGKFARRVDRGDGLPGNRIDFMAEDSEGGIWLALRTGIARVQLDSPFALHGVAQGLEGGPRALLRYHDRLYVGHNEGLAMLGDDGRFTDIPGMRLGTNRFLSHAGRLFVTSGALREIMPDNSLRQLTRQVFSPLIAIRSDPARLLGGASSGAWIDALEGTELRPVGRVEKVAGPISHLLDTGDGFAWAATPTGQIWRIDFRAGVRTDAPARSYGAADGLPPVRRRDETLLFELGGELVASSAQWLRRYDRAMDRFVPETRIDGIDAMQLGATDTTRDAAGDWWLRLGPPRRNLVRLAPADGGRWRAIELPSAPVAELVSNDLYFDSPARTLWLAGQGGLVSIALDWQPNRPTPPLRAVIRRIETPDGQSLLNPHAASIATLPANRNALRIAFAAPTYSPEYRGRTDTLYRTRLDGLDGGWSDWSPQSHRDFTNLPYRQLTFHLQARDLTGRESDDATLAFAIAPPWWLTRWAYTGYGALSLGVIGVVFALRTRALRRRNEALESVVATRTRELHAQNRELARLHRLELDEKISARLAEEKARLEVLRYQLNPHFLFNALTSVCAQIIREPVAARAMVVRLAEFCRITLHRPNEEAAMTVAQELKMLRAYLEIEQARLGDLLHLTIDADDAVNDVTIPPFLLLPLVENAVKYGTATSAERVAVRLTVRRDGEGLLIEVANSGEWLAPGAHSAPSHGIGLENLRQRLARYYPQAHEFTTAAADGWVTMRLRLSRPMREPSRA